MPAFYRRALRDFLAEDDATVIGRLTSGRERAGLSGASQAQVVAWEVTIGLLRECAKRFRSEGAGWEILLEYPIPRRGRRIDAVLIAGPALVVLEFKCGATTYDRDSIAQVEDYCLDLADFHRESRGRSLVPMLVATKAKPAPAPVEVDDGRVAATWLANAGDLPSKLRACLRRHATASARPIDAAAWDTSAYAPTPSILEAARDLYAGHNVREIARSESGAENLTRTTDAVFAAIEGARAERRKRIAFITGVPGSGKTLAGLNIVHNRRLHDGELGAFLSGNGPLVRVLTEALARDAAQRRDWDVRQSRRRVETFIQNVHRFIDAYHEDGGKVPADRVVVFDEAQRAWDAAQSARKFRRPFSEPEMLLEVMDRHPDWAVVVALVGGGQEINRGEAGLAEWGRALTSRFPHWEVLISPGMKIGDDPGGTYLFSETPEGLHLREDDALHLSVNLRSYRAAAVSEFVDAALRLEPDRARAIVGGLADFPIVLTRRLDRARRWLRGHRRGHRRIGLVASSGARRLRAHGLDVTVELDVERWFLNGFDDVRSSHYLEVPATEFAIQGLELDWVGLCWGGDLHPADGAWVARAFRGTQWQQVRDDATRRYLVNKYRVLLTRAREGLIIWVPPGDPDDPTRPPEIYDRTAEYLGRCGLRSLD